LLRSRHIRCSVFQGPILIIHLLQLLQVVCIFGRLLPFEDMLQTKEDEFGHGKCERGKNSIIISG